MDEKEKFASIFGDEPKADKPDDKEAPKTPAIVSLVMQEALTNISHFIADAMHSIEGLEEDLEIDNSKIKKLASELSSSLARFMDNGLFSPQEIVGLLRQALEVVFRIAPPDQASLLKLRQALSRLVPEKGEKAETQPLDEAAVMDSWRAAERISNEENFWKNLNDVSQGKSTRISEALGIIGEPSGEVFVVFNPHAKTGVDLCFQNNFRVQGGEYTGKGDRPLHFRLVKPAMYSRANIGNKGVTEVLRYGPPIKGIVERINP